MKQVAQGQRSLTESQQVLVTGQSDLFSFYHRWV